MKPLLLLDLDGCLNVLHPRRANSSVRYLPQQWVDGYWITLREGMPEDMHRLGEAYEIVWLSTWRDSADLVAEAFGLPEGLSFLPFDEPLPEDAGSIERKTQAAKPVIAAARAAGRRVAWVDDEITEELHAWARFQYNPSLMLCQCFPGEGLRADLVEKLLNFAAREPASWPPNDND